jgi:predicted TIM-barrel fold metal-dependent hydrolase
MAVGGDLLTFGADYPYEDSKESVDALQTLPICEADKEKFFHGNAEKVLGIS